MYSIMPHPFVIVDVNDAYSWLEDLGWWYSISGLPAWFMSISSCVLTSLSRSSCGAEDAECAASFYLFYYLNCVCFWS